MRKRLLTMLLAYLCWGVMAQDTLGPIVANLITEAKQKTDSAEFEAALALDHQALSLYEDYPIRDDSLLANVYNHISVQHYYLGDFREAIRWMEKVLLTRQQLYQTDTTTQVAMAYNNIGVFHFHRGDYRNASEYYQKALDIYAEVEEESIHLSECYSNVGACYALMGDAERAKLYVAKAIGVRIDSGDSSSLSLSKDYNNLGGIYEELNDFKNSLLYLNKALSIKKEHNRQDFYSIANSTDNIGYMYLMKGDHKKAIEKFNEAIKLRGNLEPQARFENYYSYYNIGESYLGIGQIKKAKSSFKKSRLTLLNTLDGNSPELSSILLRESFILKKEGKIQESLNLLEDILNSYSYSFDEDINFESFPSLPLLKDLLSQYVLINKFLWKKHSQEIYLDRSIKASQKLLDLLDFVRFSYKGEIARLEVIEDNIKYFELHIENLIEKYEIKKERDCQKEIFRTIERSKSRQLLDRVRSENAIVYGTVPKKLQDSLYEFAIQLNNIEDNISYLVEDGYTFEDSSVLKLIDEKFKVIKNREGLLKLIEEKFPMFYRMKYDLSIVELDFVQDSLLTKDQTVLSFFQGENNYYLLYIGKTKFELVNLGSVKSVDNKIKKFQKLISSRQLLSKRDSLDVLSMDLFSSLLGHGNFDLTSKLLIIPSGLLTQIPFSALVMQKTSGEYLINKHSLSYLYSMTWLNNLLGLSQKVNNDKNNLLVIAPDYRDSNNEKSELSEIQYNSVEAKSIHDLLGGTLLLGENASLNKFLSESNKYGFIHLATHVILKDDSQGESYLAFSNLNLDYKLYLSDIYNLNLNAKMVVLNGCETGVGKINRTEGAFSLARAFTYAGSESLVTTLWEVDDDSSMKIIQRFYEYLAKGNSKDQALRLAQLSYLSKCRKSESHPYFWAAFSHFGQLGPVTIKSNQSYSIQNYILVAVIVLLIGFIYFQIKNKY